MKTLIIGIKGTVLALERSTGAEVWRTQLKGMDFVNLALDGEQIMATTSGEVWCLDPRNGSVLWLNQLKGLGRGIVALATGSSSTNNAACAQNVVNEVATAAATTANPA
jgi:outer membrane protein assembly factor BamB